MGESRPSLAVRALRIGRAAAGTVPAPLARRLAESAAVAISHLPGDRAWYERRQMLERHLRRALGPDAPPAGSRRMRRLVDRSVASYARYWAESLRIPSLDAEKLTAGMVYDRYDYIASGVAAGRGTILTLPHLGGWEWAGTHLAVTGHAISVVVERLEPPELFDWFTSFRTELGMRVIAAGPSAGSECTAALRDNHILCLLSDRLLAGTVGVEVDFFGEKTELPAGPAALAVRTGAALLPVGVYFQDRTDSHIGIVGPPIDTSREAGFRSDIQRITQDMAAAFERLIRRDPTQWHLMQPNWPSDNGSTLVSRDGGSANVDDSPE